MREQFKRAHHKSLPILKFRLENPHVSFHDIASARVAATIPEKNIFAVSE